MNLEECLEHLVLLTDSYCDNTSAEGKTLDLSSNLSTQARVDASVQRPQVLKSIRPSQLKIMQMNRPGVSGDSNPWEGSVR